MILMIESVKAAVKRYNMFKCEKNVTVALSGGADSVALLFALNELKTEYGLKLSAAHLNHCLRGQESDGDEEFVRKLCETLGIELFCERVDIKSLSKESKESIELAARNARYEFLSRVSNGLIATAHTADDNAETVLYNMSRGTGPKGICGIPPVRDGIVRPLIFATRKQIEDYCNKNGLSYRTDSTNLCDDYARNRLRHKAVPAMQSVNSQAVWNVALLSNRMRTDDEYMSSQADMVINECLHGDGLSVENLRNQHLAIVSRVIAKVAKQSLGICLEHTHIEKIINMIEQGHGKCNILNNCFAVVSGETLKFVKSKPAAESFFYEINDFPFSKNGYTIRKTDIKDFKKMSLVNNLLFNFAIDCDKICGKLSFRSRLPGDKIALNGRGCTKTLKKLFNESKTDCYDRQGLPILADDKGVVLVFGFGVDGRVAMNDDTKNVIYIEKI